MTPSVLAIIGVTIIFSSFVSGVFGMAGGMILLCVLWPIFGWYFVGAVISFAVMWTIAFVPDKAMVYLTLGLMPFVVEALPASLRPNIEWRGVPFFTGVVTTIIQILSGVGGLFLDIFFQKSMLDRKTTN